MKTLVSVFREKVASAGEGQKVAAIHSLALLHAEAIRDFGVAAFCDEAGLAKAYRTEVTKMLAAAKYLRAEGYTVIPTG